MNLLGEYVLSWGSFRYVSYFFEGYQKNRCRDASPVILVTFV